MKFKFARIIVVTLYLGVIFLPIPLYFLYFWVSPLYYRQECLPIGDSDSDAFFRGEIKASNIEKITIYINKNEDEYINKGEYEYSTCEKLKTLPKIEIIDKNRIEQFNKNLSLYCTEFPCTSITELGREYTGAVIAEINRKKSIYFSFRIYTNRTTLIQVAPHIFDFLLDERILKEDFYNLIRTDLQKIERD